MPRPPKGVTISDVAARAGVSLSTVSRALNGNPTVDPALAGRVQAAAAELQYTASPLARSLVLGRTQTIAVVVPDLGNPTFQEILRGLNAQRDATGTTCSSRTPPSPSSKSACSSIEARRRTDGLILCAPRMAQDELDALLPQVAPVVLVNREAEPPSRSCGPTTDRRSADGSRTCYELGHRHIALPRRCRAERLRTRPPRGDRAVPPRSPRRRRSTSCPCGVDFDSRGRSQRLPCSRAARPPCSPSTIWWRWGCMSTVERARLPRSGGPLDRGFDDIPFARYTSPPLTTAAVPAAEIGTRAWEAMSLLLADGTVGSLSRCCPGSRCARAPGPPAADDNSRLGSGAL